MGWLQESRAEEITEIGLTDRSCELQLRDAARPTTTKDFKKYVKGIR